MSQQTIQSDCESFTGVVQSWELGSDLPLLTADDTLGLSWFGSSPNMPEKPLSPGVTVIKQEDVEPHSTNAIEPNTDCANHCAEDWPGDIGFQVKFEDFVATNNVWTYSEDARKLYTVFNNALPVYFTTEEPPPPGTTVCIVPVFRDPDLRLKNVIRCPVHVAKNPDDNSRDHWILCDHPTTVYSEDEANGQRRFLTVPFEDPDPDSNALFTYRLRFMCRNSCIGTMNRRATDVFFILRSPEGQDLARRVIEVKVSACPHRDRKHDEILRKPADVKNAAAGGSCTRASDVEDVGSSVNKHGKRKIYTIEVYDREKYEFLRKVQVAWELADVAMAMRKKRMAMRNAAQED